MIVLTTTEFLKDFDKYLDMLKDTELLLIKNGKVVAKLTSATTSIVDELAGILSEAPQDIDMKKVRKERLEKKYGDI